MPFSIVRYGNIAYDVIYVQHNKVDANSNRGIEFRHNNNANFLLFSGNVSAKTYKEIAGSKKLLEDR